MSYDLAVWRGPQPASDEAAQSEYERLLEQSEDDEAAPPAAQIEAFVADLLDRSPDGPGPWATSSLLDDAAGDLLLVTMTTDGAATAVPLCTRTARDHGLVCFDPQVGRVLPPA